MADQRDGGIGWTDQTWSPIRGCSIVSPGCHNCYAQTMAARFCGPGQPYEGLAEIRHGKPHWSGEVRIIEKHLHDPLRWRRPRKIFVNSMSDMFHEKLADSDIDTVFAIMLATHVLDNKSKHVYQILTKRSKRMAEYFSASPIVLLKRWAAAGRRQIDMADRDISFDEYVGSLCAKDDVLFADPLKIWPLKDVWLGVSVEDQRRAEERIPDILKVPAAVRFLSVEPMLGPVDLTRIEWPEKKGHKVDVLRFGFWSENHGFVNHSDMHDEFGKISWVICGAESGAGARPMQLEWVRALRDQCVETKTAFFFKQMVTDAGKKIPSPILDGKKWEEYPVAQSA